MVLHMIVSPAANDTVVVRRGINRHKIQTLLNDCLSGFPCLYMGSRELAPNSMKVVVSVTAKLHKLSA